MVKRLAQWAHWRRRRTAPGGLERVSRVRSRRQPQRGQASEPRPRSEGGQGATALTGGESGAAAASRGAEGADSAGRKAEGMAEVERFPRGRGRRLIRAPSWWFKVVGATSAIRGTVSVWKRPMGRRGW